MLEDIDTSTNVKGILLQLHLDKTIFTTRTMLVSLGCATFEGDQFVVYCETIIVAF